MSVDFPDFTRGIVKFTSAGTVTAVDFPDWTDGLVVLSSPLAPPGDLPDWTKAVSEVAGASPAPPVTTGLLAQYDAQQITGVADGTAVSSWADLSGNGLTLTQSTPANQPTYYKTTAAHLINGHPAIFFAGVQNSVFYDLANASLASQTTWTVFAVVKCDHFSGFNAQTFTGDTGATTPFRFLYDTVLHDYQVGNNGGTITGGTPDGNPHLLCAVNNGASSLLALDGTTLTSGTLGLVAIAPPFHVGSAGAANTGPFFGSIGEVVVYNGALSTSDQSSVTGYLKSRWGIP